MTGPFVLDASMTLSCAFEGVPMALRTADSDEDALGGST